MVTERYIPIWGGAENQLRQLIPHLVSKGCAVEIVTRRWYTEMLQKEMVDTVLVHRIGWPGSGILSTVSFVFCLIIFLLFKCRDTQIFHSHGALKIGGLCAIGAKLTRKKNIAKIATAGHIPKLLQTWRGRLIIGIFKRSDAIIFMTPEIENELIRIACQREKMICIRNAVDTNRFKPADNFSRREFLKKYQIDETELLIVFSSRLVPRKGIDILFAAWPEVYKKNPHARLLIMGSGKDQPDSIEEIMKERVETENLGKVIFLGEMSEPEKILGVADIFVFPSREEGFPNALMEALAAGLPSVCSRIGGVLPLVEDGENGVLFETENAVQLAEKLDMLLRDQELRIRLGGRARSIMEEKYSFEKTAEEYCQLYEKLSQQSLGKRVVCS